jgi:hypothetical protein
MTVIATPFAEVEQAMNADVLAMLANAVATVVEPADAAGMQFAVTFDDAYLFIDTASGLESSSPAATVLEEAMPEAVRDALVAADGEVILEIVYRNRCTAYRVAESKPDGTGVTVLRLRK